MSNFMKNVAPLNYVSLMFVVIAGLVTGLVIQLRWFYFHSETTLRSIFEESESTFARLVLSPVIVAVLFVIIFWIVAILLKKKDENAEILKLAKSFLIFALLLLWPIFVYKLWFLFAIISIFIFLIFSQISLLKNFAFICFRTVYYHLQWLFLNIINIKFLNTFLKNNFLISLLIAFIAIFGIFKYHFGFVVLDVTSISWLMDHDWAQHFLGWHFYRDAPWSFPLGRINDFYYPVGTYIGYTDSIPLFAFIFKIFNNCLPDAFQYIGLWFLLCFSLQALFAALLLKEFKIALLPQIIGVLLFLFSPILLVRFQHPALCAHWLIIACFWLWFYAKKENNRKKSVFLQLFFLFLSTLIHPYLCVITAVFTIALFWKMMLNGKLKGFLKFVVLSSVSFFIIVTSWYSTGYIGNSSGYELSVWGYGYFSTNLNSLFNPSGASAFINELPIYTPEQILEGFSYLGLGMILLALILIVVKIAGYYYYPAVTPVKKSSVHRNFILVFIAIAFFVFSLSNVITFGNILLFEIPLSETVTQLLSPFRSTGRFIWPLYYLIFLTIIVYFGRGNLVSQKTSNIVLAICFIIQFADIQPLRRNFYLTDKPYEEFINFDFDKWKQLYSEVDQILFYPPFDRQYVFEDDYIPFAYLAANMDKKINIGYLARADRVKQFNATQDFESMISHGYFSPKIMIVTSSNYISRFYDLITDHKIGFAYFDGYFVGLSKQNKNFRADWFPKTYDCVSFLKKYNDKTIFISVKDEASQNLSQAIKDYFKKLGSQVEKLEFRGSWVAIIKNEKIIFEKINNSNNAEITLNQNNYLNGILISKDIFVHSSGYDYGNESIIKINDVDYSRKLRGINVVVTDADLNVIDLINFDTHLGINGFSFSFY